MTMIRKHIFYGALTFALGCIAGSAITYGIISKDVKTETTTPQPTPPPSPVKALSEYQGIDVSNHQGRIDWSLVSKDENIKFVYIKASEGATHTDKSYLYNIKEARKNGLKCGSYHYLRNTSRIAAQFENFKSSAKKEMQDLIPMVDVEEKVHKDSIQLFCSLREEHYGKRPAIYGTNRSYNTYCAPDFNDYILMIGRYGKKKPIIKGKGRYSIWQYSEKGKIDGIKKPVDLDRIHPDFDLSRLEM